MEATYKNKHKNKKY